jgi:hypothetical protein
MLRSISTCCCENSCRPIDPPESTVLIGSSLRIESDRGTFESNGRSSVWDRRMGMSIWANVGEGV